MNIAICLFKSLNLRHLRFLRQIFPSSKNISGCVQIVSFANVSLFQSLTLLRLNNSVKFIFLFSVARAREMAAPFSIDEYSLAAGEGSTDQRGHKIFSDPISFLLNESIIHENFAVSIIK